MNSSHGGILCTPALEPFTARTESDGPIVMLSAKNAQNFSLALRELATNAVKHGALSSADGNVSIVWTIAKIVAVQS